MHTTLVGRPLSEIDTPALVVDLDALEHNIKTMAADITARGAQWRPHSKANKTPAIVHLEIAAGAIGVTCAKVGEAEVMATNGIRDILIANQVVGPIKTRRLANLASYSDVIVAVDNPDNVREHNAAACEAGTRPRVVVEVNVGMERCGVLPGKPAVELAKPIESMPNLRFAGVMAWEGHAMSIADVKGLTSGDRKTALFLVALSNVNPAGATEQRWVVLATDGTTAHDAGVSVMSPPRTRSLGASPLVPRSSRTKLV